MPNYLRSAFIKLERANRRIVELEGEIDTFLNEEANATRGYEDPEEADAFRRQHDSRRTSGSDVASPVTIIGCSR